MSRNITLENVLRPLEPVINQIPSRQNFWLPNKTQSLPDLSKINHETNEKILESAVKNAVKNLRYDLLRSLLHVPIIPSDSLIIEIMVILLISTFSPEVMRKDYGYRHRFALYNFTVLLCSIPKKKYPLIASLICENFWLTPLEEENFELPWPSKFLEMLMEVDYKLFNKDLLLKIYKNNNVNYYWINNSIHHLYLGQYELLKRLITKFYTIDENIGSKIVKGKDILIYEKIINCISPLCFHKQLIFKRVCITPKNPSLKELCRKNIRFMMKKTNIHYTLTNLALPETLKRYLLHIEDIRGNNNQEYRLTFMTPHLLKSEINQFSSQGPIINISNDHELDCSNFI